MLRDGMVNGIWKNNRVFILPSSHVLLESLVMIRNASDAEIEDLIAIYSQFETIFKKKGHDLPPEHLKGEGLKKWIEESIQYHGVCERDGKIAGCLYLHKVDDEIFIHTLAVCESYQGQGVGSELVQAALRIAQRENCRLCVESYELFGVRVFYEKMGFHYEGSNNVDGFPYLIFKMPKNLDP